MTNLISGTPNLINGVSQQPIGLRLPSQAERQENCYVSVANGLQKRHPTQWITQMFTSASAPQLHVHYADRGDSDGGSGTERYVFTFQDNEIRCWEIDGTEIIVHDLPSDPGQLFQYIECGSEDPNKLLRTLTVLDYTFIVNRSLSTAMKTTLTHPSQPADGKIAFAFIRSSGFSREYSIRLKGTFNSVAVDIDFTIHTCAGTVGTSGAFQHTGPAANTVHVAGPPATTGYDYPTYDTVNYAGPPTPNTTIVSDGVRDSSAEQVAIFFEALLNSRTDLTTAPSTLALTREGAVLKFTCSGSDEIELLEAHNPDFISCWHHRVNNIDDLPIICEHDYVVEVAGDPDGNEDDYYLQFKLEEGTSGMGKGYWVETSKPGEKYQINTGVIGNTGWPTQLVRSNADGAGAPIAFLGGGANEKYFSHELMILDDRLVGDRDLNPFPSIVSGDGTDDPSRFIRDVFFWRNRLGFVADDKIVMSAAGSFFNYFRTSVRELLDSDPIDLDISHTKVSILNGAVPLNRSLILFSDRTQFSLTGEPLLTPKSAGVSAVTEFPSQDRSRPEGVGRGILFAGSKTSDETRAGMHEFFALGDGENFDAADLTAHVPDYVVGRVLSIDQGPRGDMVVVTTDSTNNELYVYQFHTQEGKRVQNAWHKWIMSETAASARVLAARFIAGVLYVVIWRASAAGNAVHLEKMEIEEEAVDPGETILTLIDRRIDDTDLASAVYTASDDTTVLTLPTGYSLTTGSQPVVVLRDGTGREPRIRTYSEASGTIDLQGDYSSTDLWIGERYVAEYELSPQQLRVSFGGRGEAGVLAEEHKLKAGVIGYEDTAHFTVLVTPKGRAQYQKVFNGRPLGVASVVGQVYPENGAFRFPVYSRARDVEIIFRNSSPHQMKLTHIEWESALHRRGLRG